MASPTFPGPRLFGRQTGGQVVEDDPTFLQAYLQSSRNAAAEREAQQRGQQVASLETLRAMLTGQNQMALEQQRALDRGRQDWQSMNPENFPEGSPLRKAITTNAQWPELGPGMSSQSLRSWEPFHKAYLAKEDMKQYAGMLKENLGKPPTPEIDEATGVAKPFTSEDRGHHNLWGILSASEQTGMPIPQGAETAALNRLLGDSKDWIPLQGKPGWEYNASEHRARRIEGLPPEKSMTEQLQDLQGVFDKSKAAGAGRPNVPPKFVVTQRPGVEGPTISTTFGGEQPPPRTFEQRVAEWVDMPEGPNKVAEGKKLDAIAEKQAKAGGLLAQARGQSALDLPFEASSYGRNKVVLDAESFIPITRPGSARDVMDAKAGGHAAVVTTADADKINFYRGILPNLTFLEQWAPQVLSGVGPGQTVGNAVVLFANRRFGTGTPEAQQFIGAWDEVRRAAVTGMTRAETGGVRPAVLVYQMINDVTGKDTDTARRALGQFGASKQVVQNQMRALAGLPTQAITMPGSTGGTTVPGVRLKAR